MRHLEQFETPFNLRIWVLSIHILSPFLVNAPFSKEYNKFLLKQWFCSFAPTNGTKQWLIHGRNKLIPIYIKYLLNHESKYPRVTITSGQSLQQPPCIRLIRISIPTKQNFCLKIETLS